MRRRRPLIHKQYAEAAPEYEVANALAVEMENPLLELETARMASFCHYHGGDHMKAWEWGDVGLRAVEDMPKEAVPMTTFPFLVDHLDEVRLRGGLNESERRTFRLDSYMVKLLGENWRPQIKEMLP